MDPSTLGIVLPGIVVGLEPPQSSASTTHLLPPGSILAVVTVVLRLMKQQTFYWLAFSIQFAYGCLQDLY